MTREAGLTLIEMLLVVFILSVVSLGAVALLDGKESAICLDETRNKLRQLRTAIVGRPAFDPDAALAGYVVDMGTLPTSLDDLVRPPVDGALAHAPRHPAFDDTNVLDDAAHRLPKGWRGPYLMLPPSEDPVNAIFRDGWGNGVRTDPDHGWLCKATGADLRVESVGADGAPATGDEIGLVIADRDWRVNLNGWALSVTGYPDSDTDLRARLLVWSNGTWQRHDTEAGNADADGKATLAFGADVFVPVGRHLVVLAEDSGSSVSPCERDGRTATAHVRVRARHDLPAVTLEAP